MNGARGKKEQNENTPYDYESSRNQVHVGPWRKGTIYVAETEVDEGREDGDIPGHTVPDARFDSVNSAAIEHPKSRNEGEGKEGRKDIVYLPHTQGLLVFLIPKHEGKQREEHCEILISAQGVLVYGSGALFDSETIGS